MKMFFCQVVVMNCLLLGGLMMVSPFVSEVDAQERVWDEMLPTLLKSWETTGSSLYTEKSLTMYQSTFEYLSGDMRYPREILLKKNMWKGLVIKNEKTNKVMGTLSITPGIVALKSTKQMAKYMYLASQVGRRVCLYTKFPAHPMVFLGCVLLITADVDQIIDFYQIGERVIAILVKDVKEVKFDLRYEGVFIRMSDLITSPFTIFPKLSERFEEYSVVHLWAGQGSMAVHKSKGIIYVKPHLAASWKLAYYPDIYLYGNLRGNGQSVIKPEWFKLKSMSELPRILHATDGKGYSPFPSAMPASKNLEIRKNPNGSWHIRTIVNGKSHVKVVPAPKRAKRKSSRKREKDIGRNIRQNRLERRRDDDTKSSLKIKFGGDKESAVHFKGGNTFIDVFTPIVVTPRY